jgi:hypothetical protein
MDFVLLLLANVEQRVASPATAAMLVLVVEQATRLVNLRLVLITDI